MPPAPDRRGRRGRPLGRGRELLNGTSGESPESVAYATAVEEAFIAERGTPFLLSPKDWQLIEEWQEKGVPLGTVVRAVRETFERRRARAAAGKISSLAYCANTVEELWAFERRGLAGGGKGLPPADLPDASAGVELLRRALAEAAEAPPASVADGAFGDAVRDAAEKVAAIRTEQGIEAVEQALVAIESAMLKALRRALSEEAAAELAKRVDPLLEGTSGLPGPARGRLRKALERREIRRMLDLPVLTVVGG